VKKKSLRGGELWWRRERYIKENQSLKSLPSPKDAVKHEGKISFWPGETGKDILIEYEGGKRGKMTGTHTRWQSKCGVSPRSKKLNVSLQAP